MTDSKREVWIYWRPNGDPEALDSESLALGAHPLAERYVPAPSVPEAPEPAKALEWHETLQANIRACSAAVLMACGAPDQCEPDAEQLRVAALRCRDLAAALRKAIDAHKPEPTKAEREALFRFLRDAIKDTHDDVGFDKDYTDFNRGQRNAFARVQVWLLRDKLDTSLPAPPDSEAKLKGWDESPGPFSPGEFLANKPDSESK